MSLEMVDWSMRAELDLNWILIGYRSDIKESMIMKTAALERIKVRARYCTAKAHYTR